MESWINSKPLKILIQKTIISIYYNNGIERDIIDKKMVKCKKLNSISKMISI